MNKNIEKYKVVIVGQGAIGLLWYKHFQKNCQNIADISLLTSAKKHQSQSTFTFTSFSDVTENIIINHTNEHDLLRADIILLCVKSYQVKKAIENIAFSIQPQAQLILCHNGMGTLAELSDNIKKQHSIFTLLITHGCRKIAPWHIKHTGKGQCDLGLLFNNVNKPRVEAQIKTQIETNNKNHLQHLFHQALPTVFFHENILEKQWIKLAINCVINPITALNNIDNGDVLANKYSSTIEKILQEVITVASACDINLIYDELFMIVERVAETTAINCSSMRCDILNKQKSEVDYINGYIHRLGLKYNIATAENSKLWQQISALHPAE